MAETDYRALAAVTALAALRRAADRIGRGVGRAARVHGITARQYAVLRLLADAGPAGLPTLELARRMVERAPGVTRMMDRLERLGLATRRRDDSDRRRVYCVATPAAVAALDRIANSATDSERDAFRLLTHHEVAALARMLDRVAT